MTRVSSSEEETTGQETSVCGGELGSDSWQPVDHAARDRIRHALDRTIFAVAGAGSGKTTHLVERVCQLVVQGRARIDELAVITFTEAAAAELRDRVAEALETVAKNVENPAAAERAADALAGLDGAAITTLHGFARRILAAHPFEAGLPATFEVLDEARSLAELDQQWHGVVSTLLDDAETARAVQWLVVSGADVHALRQILRRLGENWDRAAPRGSDLARPLPRLDTSNVVAPLTRALDLAPCCTDPDDTLLRHLVALRRALDALREAGADELGILGALTAASPSYAAANKGRAPAWGGRKPEVLTLLSEAQTARLALVDVAVDAALRKVVATLGELTVDAARRRRQDGRLQYHDLLVLACTLVRRHREVRASLHEEFRAILVDEFQDTDPLQAELVCMIAAEPTADVERTVWWELPMAPGALFFVGDPLQSIYGFRRADIATFLRVQADVAQETASLVTNFRALGPIVDWVNAVFAALVGEGAGTLQPPHEPSVAARPVSVVRGGASAVARADGHASAPQRCVTVLGAGGEGAPSAEAARAREAQELAVLLRRAVAEGWPIGRDGRPVQPDDIAVLVPSRRSVPALEAAFDEVALPYRLESSSLVYGAAEVNDLLHVLRAIDDPSDAAAVVAALRTPGFGCGDDDLVRFRLSGGTWDYRTLERVAGAGDEPVRRGLGQLAALHESRGWMDVSELVARVVEDRRQLGAALDDRRWREEWRRLRFVADQARQFVEGSSGGLREYLAWVAIQREDEARVTEVVLPEADAPAVAVMTVHAAKGLEFPVVAVVGLGTAPQAVRCPTVLFGPDGMEVGLKATRWTGGFEDARTREKAVQAHERLRLLYVAATRAQHHLVVSVHRASRGTGESTAARLEAVLDEARDLWAAPDAPDGSPPHEGDPQEGARRAQGAASTVTDTADELVGWAQTRAARLAPYRRVVAATSVASLAANRDASGDARDLAASGAGAAASVLDDAQTPPEGAPGGGALWRRGRGGTAVGRAVHAVLQTVDLATGEGVEAMAAVHATREGVPDRAGEIAALAHVALDSDLVRRASAGRYWRELYVGVPVGPRVLEGFVDLLVDGPDGLEVVDYKTDRIAGDAHVDDLVQRHRLQGAAYAYAVRAVTGRDVARCTFLFLRGDAAVAGSVPDLPQAMDDVARLMGAEPPSSSPGAESPA